MNVALILASGIGSRINSNIPKQFIRINDKPLLIMTIEAFDKCSSIDEIIVVASKEHIDDINKLIQEYNIKKVRSVISGGCTRQESSYNGIMFLSRLNSLDDIVLIHDAARPLLVKALIEENIDVALKYDAAITAIKSTDTIFISKDGHSVNNTTNRNELFAAQTPQTFRLGVIKKAHEYAKANNINDVSDDAQLVHLLNQEIKIVKGSSLNFKVTTDFDLKVLKMIVEKGR